MFRISAAIALTLLVTALASSSVPANPNDPLAALAPMVDKTWRAETVEKDGETMVDVQRWEWILGGRAMRIMHSLNDGAYGGQTTVYPDPEGDSMRFHYVTTGGFVTEGTITIEDGVMTAVEDVTGHPSITKVKNTTELKDGTLQSRSKYLQNGEWVAGHSFDYREAPDAKPVFPPVR